jgi:hypothetical protein
MINTEHRGELAPCQICGTPTRAGLLCPSCEDGTALDVIAEMLRDPSWGAGMLEDIADLVRGTGRSVENYPDNRATWGRH